jgi:hypothetical protein
LVEGEPPFAEKLERSMEETYRPASASLPATPAEGGPEVVGQDRSTSQAPMQDVPSTAREAVRSLVGQGKEQLLGKVAAGKDGIAAQIEGFAESVHGTSEQFAGKQDWLARAIAGGAQELSSLAEGLRQTDIISLFSRVQSLARRKPELFVGAGLATGFVIARVAKLAAADMSRDDLPSIPEVRNGKQ